MRVLSGVKLPRLPRMADFAVFAVACERGCGEPARFLSAYSENQAGAHEQALESSPLPLAVVALMDGRERWEGTPAELHVALSQFAPTPEPKDWPKRANALTNKLRRLAPNLRRVHGLHIEDGRTSGGKSGGKRSRFVRITRDSSSPSSPSDNPTANSGDVPTTRDDPEGRCATEPTVIVPGDRPHSEQPKQPDFQRNSPLRDGGDDGDDESRPTHGVRFGNNDRRFDMEGHRW